MTSAESAQAAKQLDSVTDRVQETELDASKAKQAMSAMMSTGGENDVKLSQIRVSRDDIAVVVKELEVTEDTAEATLKQVSLEIQQAGGSVEGSVVLEGALRRLITAVPGQ